MRSIVAIALVAWLLSACGSADGIQSRSVEVPRGSAESLELSLTIAGRDGSLAALSDDNLLFRGDLAHLGELIVEQGDDSAASLAIREETEDASTSEPTEEPLLWEMNVSDDVPITLNLTLDSSAFTGTLGTIQLSELVLVADASQTTLDLPATQAIFPVNASVTNGTLALNLPDNSGAQVRSLTSEAATISVSVGSGASFDTDVEVSDGTVGFSVASDVGVRVFADATSGNLSVPESFTQTARNDSFVGDSTTYVSPNFESAATRITLRVSVTAGSVQIEQS